MTDDATTVPAEHDRPEPVLRWYCCDGSVAHCWCPHRPILPADDDTTPRRPAEEPAP